MNEAVAVLKGRLITYKDPKNPGKTEKWKLDKDLNKCTEKEKNYMIKAGVTVADLMEEGFNRGQVAHMLYGYKHVDAPQTSEDDRTKEMQVKTITWNDVWYDKKRLIRTMLKKTHCKQKGSDLYVFISDPFTFDVMKKNGREKDIERLLLEDFGVSLSVMLVWDGDTPMDTISFEG